MYPLALTVSHVKWNPDKLSLATSVAISKEMGFKGACSIEIGDGLESYAVAYTNLDRLFWVYLTNASIREADRRT